jgi:hypothetical protein
MRISLIVALALGGCSSDALTAAGNDMAIAGDLAGDDLPGTVEADLYGVIEDLTPSGDVNPTNPSDLAGVDAQNPANDLGGVGTACTTACDCMPGLGCVQNMCISGILAVYCCEGTTCPANSLCQHTSGTYGQCGGGTTPDLGGFDSCRFIGCQGGMGLQKCMNAGCSMCVANTGGMGPTMVCAR